MSKNKPRNTDIIFELKREIRDLKEIIRKLQIKLTNGTKEEKREQKALKAEPKIKKDSDCPECDGGTLTTLDLNVRIIISCNECRYRKVSKK